MRSEKQRYESGNGSMMSGDNIIVKDKGFFGNFEPLDVLIWLDGPRTFTLLDQDGKLCFAHWLQELEGLWQYVVDQQFVVQSVSLTTWEQLPQDALPERGTI